MRMKDLDKMSIEDLIKLPFFHSLEKSFPDPKKYETMEYWKITLRCNKINNDGTWGLLDFDSETEYVIRYKIMDFKK